MIINICYNPELREETYVFCYHSVVYCLVDRELKLVSHKPDVCSQRVTNSELHIAGENTLS